MSYAHVEKIGKQEYLVSSFFTVVNLTPLQLTHITRKPGFTIVQPGKTRAGRS